MKQIYSFILIIAVLMQSFSNLVVIVGYELNKEYISKNLCENRAMPQMHCNGKCHMNKELKALDKKDQSPVSSTKEKQETLQYVSERNPFSLSTINNIVKQRTIYTESALPQVTFSIFHPPSC